MAQADSGHTVDSTGEVVYNGRNADGKAIGVMVGCESTSANNALVSVQGMHESTQFLTLEPGQKERFWSPDGVGPITVKGDGGDAVITWGVIAR